MSAEERAKEILKTAERAMAELANEAVSTGGYEVAARFLTVAQQLADLSRHLASRGDERAGQDNASSGHDDALVESSMAKFAAAAVSSGKRASGDAYPRFAREGDTLVKIGWSKSDRAEYEHRSPKSVLLRLAQESMRVGAGGKRFTTEQIMPLHDSDGGELPSYQCYLCLAWLVAADLVERHGRQGYTLRGTIDFDKAVLAKWETLPKR